MTWIADPGQPRLRRLMLVAVTLGWVFVGCTENTVPQITQLKAEPACDIITTHDDGDYLEVRFFGRASGGNVKSDPTGANSPLDWNWSFGDGATAGNVVNPVHRYTAPGLYEVTLTVKDDDGDSDQRKIEVLVGETYGDLDILNISARRVGDPRIALVRNGNVNEFVGWDASFEGHLQTPCPIGGFFQTYTWLWDFSDGSTLLHVGEPTHRFPPVAQNYEVFLTVTENNTQAARTDTVQVSFPSGVRLGNSDVSVLPGQNVTLTLDGLLTVGLDRLTAYFSWPDSFGINAAATITPELQAEGFTMTEDASVLGVLRLDFQAPTGMASTAEVIPFADITFSRAVGFPRVEPGPFSIDLDSLSVVTANGEPRSSNGLGGDFVVDNDCNDNLIPDVQEDDCDGNGYVDSCDIADGRADDCNGNGIPDACEIEADKLLDCNRNGILDECEIANGTGLDCNNNGRLDECETDCNNNGVPDDCDIANGTSLDCDGNGIPDECEDDCDFNGIADVCELLNGTATDCDGNGIIDVCDPDCNQNGIADACDIANGTSQDCNNNGIPDECEPDCNNNGFPDDCDITSGRSQDLNGNGVPDDCE